MMTDLVEMLKAQTEAINTAYRQGIEEGRQLGYREGRADGLEEARKTLEKAFPNGKLPVSA